ncbi:MAG: PBSX family phage terminase large subunit [Daejeonella sp.]
MDILKETLTPSPLYTWNAQATEAVVVNQGGTSSGKTYSILQLLFVRALQTPNLVITVAGQDIPNLKVGALRDAADIVTKCVSFQQALESYNKTDRIYKFKNGSVIEFNSYDDEQDAKSGKRDYLFVNEANGITLAIYNQLALRTRLQVFIDYNPNAEFWVHDNLLKEPNVRLIISDHRHNPFLSQAIHEKIESLKLKDPELFKVYGRGLTGKIEGLVFRDWHIVEDIPQDATFVGGGLDFGFTNDPTAFVAVYKQNGELWIDELIYEYGLTNPQICDQLFNKGYSYRSEIIADSAEPKSIEEIKSGGFYVNPASKGADSIRIGINILKRYRLNITMRSAGLRKEIKGYKYKEDKTAGRMLNEPIDFNNHALDALRYVALNKLQANEGSGNYSFI